MDIIASKYRLRDFTPVVALGVWLTGTPHAAVTKQGRLSM